MKASIVLIPRCNLMKKGEKAEINPTLRLDAGLTEHLHIAAFSVCGSTHVYSETTETPSVLSTKP